MGVSDRLKSWSVILQNTNSANKTTKQNKIKQNRNRRQKQNKNQQNKQRNKQINKQDKNKKQKFEIL